MFPNPSLSMSVLVCPDIPWYLVCLVCPELGRNCEAKSPTMNRSSLVSYQGRYRVARAAKKSGWDDPSTDSAPDGPLYQPWL